MMKKIIFPLLALSMFYVSSCKKCTTCSYETSYLNENREEVNSIVKQESCGNKSSRESFESSFTSQALRDSIMSNDSIVNCTTR